MYLVQIFKGLYYCDSAIFQKNNEIPWIPKIEVLDLPLYNH